MVYIGDADIWHGDLRILKSKTSLVNMYNTKLTLAYSVKSLIEAYIVYKHEQPGDHAPFTTVLVIRKTNQ